jgi:hypothetical protein
MIAAAPLALLALFFFLGFLRHAEGPHAANAGFATPKTA